MSEIMNWVVIAALVIAAVLYFIYPQHQQDPTVIEKWQSANTVIVFVEAETWGEARTKFYKEYPDYLIIEHEEVKGGFLIKAKKGGS